MNRLRIVLLLIPLGSLESQTLPARALGYYDAGLGRVVLVGGIERPRAGERDHVWSWTGTRWEQSPDSGPPARGNGSGAYDARRRMGVVAGGARQRANENAYDIIADSWEQTPTGWRRITGTEIDARDHNSLVFDERAQVVLAFGGIGADRSAPWPTDTWELRPAGWARVATSGPAARGRTAMVYDSKRRQVVLFGGVGAEPALRQPQPFFGDTWLWQSRDAGWKKVADSGPRGRYAHGMVFDERAGVVLLYSGAGAHRDAPLTDMWQWDGTRWSEIPLTGPTPGFRYQPVMVYDRARGKTVLYGGSGADDTTWEWDGREWRPIQTARP